MKLRLKLWTLRVAIFLHSSKTEQVSYRLIPLHSTHACFRIDLPVICMLQYFCEDGGRFEEIG